AIRISTPEWLSHGKRAWYYPREPRKGTCRPLDVTAGKDSDLCAKEQPHALRVSPDGTRVLGGTFGRRLFVAPLDCSTITLLAPPDGWGNDLGPTNGLENSPESMAFSPSGQKV